MSIFFYKIACIHCIYEYIYLYTLYVFTVYLFSHFRNGMENLTHKEQLVFQQVREFISRSEKITIRGLQTILGYASPRSISVLLDQIMDK